MKVHAHPHASPHFPTPTTSHIPPPHPHPHHTSTQPSHTPTLYAGLPGKLRPMSSGALPYLRVWPCGVFGDGAWLHTGKRRRAEQLYSSRYGTYGAPNLLPN